MAKSLPIVFFLLVNVKAIVAKCRLMLFQSFRSFYGKNNFFEKAIGLFRSCCHGNIAFKNSSVVYVGSIPSEIRYDDYLGIELPKCEHLICVFFSVWKNVFKLTRPSNNKVMERLWSLDYFVYSVVLTNCSAVICIFC